MEKVKWLMGLMLVALLVMGCQVTETPITTTTPEAGTVVTQVSGYGELAISPAHTYKNMTLFVLSRTTPEAAKPVDCLTLEEGLVQQKVVVSEKEQADVQTLQVENLADKPLFIQVGDVLRGGKQDRTIQASLIIPPRSGKVDVPSLCVEESRWTGQIQFKSAGNFANDKYMKIAIQKGDQGQVWQEVAKYKETAEKVTGDTAKNSSLNEALDNEKLKQACDDYNKAFAKLLDEYPQSIGLAYALNGQIQSVELFQSNGLLRKAYDKIIRSYASDAVVNQSGKITDIGNIAIKDFLAEMEKGETKKQLIMGNQLMMLENGLGISSEVQDADKKVMHREYLKK